MAGKLVISASSKEKLESEINKYFFSKNYIITDDNKVFNTFKNTYLDLYEVSVVRGRWQFRETV